MKEGKEREDKGNEKRISEGKKRTWNLMTGMDKTRHCEDCVGRKREKGAEAGRLLKRVKENLTTGERYERGVSDQQESEVMLKSSKRNEWLDEAHSGTTVVRPEMRGSGMHAEADEGKTEKCERVWDGINRLIG